MEPLQLVGYIIEGITITAGALSTYSVLKKDRKYIGNVMMALSIAAITLYMLCITIYDIFLPIFKEDLLVYIFLPLGLSAIVSAGMFMFFTMMVMTKGEWWVRTVKKTIWYIIPVVVFSLWVLIFGSQLITIENYEYVDTDLEIQVLIILGVLALFFIVSSMILTYRSGIKKAQGATKTKLVRFEAGLAVMLFALIFNVAKGFIGGETIGPILDMTYFGILGAGTVIFAYSLMEKEKNKQ